MLLALMPWTGFLTWKLDRNKVILYVCIVCAISPCVQRS